MLYDVYYVTLSIAFIFYVWRFNQRSDTRFESILNALSALIMFFSIILLIIAQVGEWSVPNTFRILIPAAVCIPVSVVWIFAKGFEDADE